MAGFLHLQNQFKEPKFGSEVYKTSGAKYESYSRCQTPIKHLQNPPKPQIWTRELDALCAFKIILGQGSIKEKDFVKIMIKMKKNSQKPSTSSESLFQDLRYIEILSTLKNILDGQNSDKGLSNFKNYVQIMIKIPNQDQEPLVSFKAPIKTERKMRFFASLK